MSSPTLDFQIPEKLAPIAEHPRRYNIIPGGRGGSRSWSTARLLIIKGYREKRRILCAREIQKSLEDSVYQLLMDQIELLGLSGFYRGIKNKIEGLNGTQFLFHGIRTEDITKIKSLENCTDCWVEEAQIISDKSWRILAPTIRAKGSKFYITFNPELEDDPTYERFIVNPPKDSHVIEMNYNDNPWFKDTELEQERLADYERDKTPDKHVYGHTWLGKTMPAVEGAIFSNEVSEFIADGRYRDLNYDPMGKVHGIMDLGYGVMTMVLAQKFAQTVQIIGYHEWRNSTYAKITKELQDEYPDYRWGKIFMPHDASHRDPKTGYSHYQVMEDLGWNTEKVPQEGIENYIEKGRRLFLTCYINKANGGDDLMRCLRRFKYKIPVDNPNKRMMPDKDDFAHGAESFCYTAVVADKLVNEDLIITDPYRGLQSGYAA